MQLEESRDLPSLLSLLCVPPNPSFHGFQSELRRPIAARPRDPVSSPDLTLFDRAMASSPGGPQGELGRLTNKAFEELEAALKADEEQETSTALRLFEV